MYPRRIVADPAIRRSREKCASARRTLLTRTALPGPGRLGHHLYDLDMSIRVIQWGSGNVGRHALRTVADHPEMELVGLMVTDPSKVGRDVGDIGGFADLGIRATDDLDELVAIDADVVLHMPLPSLVYGDTPGADLDNFCRLLASGKHVITTVGYMYPQVYGDEVMDRLTAACAAGGVAFHGTGANPGWFGDLLPLMMSGLSLRIDAIDVQEISNFQHYPSPEIMFDMMNFGRTPEEFDAAAARHRAWLDGLFTEAVEMVAAGLGVATTETTSEMETWIAQADLDTAAGGRRRHVRRAAVPLASDGRRCPTDQPGDRLADARPGRTGLADRRLVDPDQR